MGSLDGDLLSNLQQANIRKNFFSNLKSNRTIQSIITKNEHENDGNEYSTRLIIF